MTDQKTVPIKGADGPLGFLLANSADQEYVTVILTDGRHVSVSSSTLVKEDDGSYSVPLRLGDFDSAGADTILPVISEELVVGKRQVETGRVRVSKAVRERQEIVQMPLIRERVDIRRVIFNRDIDAPLPVREEGDTVIVPVMEQVLVVEKRLRLKEEIHITRRKLEEQVNERVTLTSEEAVLERLHDNNSPDR
jgi:uncharacterized protein (TIGR02271 family)